MKMLRHIIESDWEGVMAAIFHPLNGVKKKQRVGSTSLADSITVETVMVPALFCVAGPVTGGYQTERCDRLLESCSSLTLTPACSL